MIQHATTVVAAFALFAMSLMGQTANKPSAATPKFEAPKRVNVGSAFVETETPGYASPAIHDVNGDGLADLVVGQFADGKMHVFHGQQDGSFGAGKWIIADGKTAIVPDVW